jgi:acetoacetyl-CoA synthetase
MSEVGTEAPLWTPDRKRAQSTRLAQFAERARAIGAIADTDYATLHRWSVDDPAGFWALAWDELGVVGERGETAYQPADKLWQARFFPHARLNYAENVLRRNDHNVAIIAAREDGLRRNLSWRELKELVSRVELALRDAGVGPGDRVAAWLPNVPEAYALMLASAAIGAIFTSASPDFGVNGVVDRFGQIEPRVLVGVDAYLYGGKRVNCLERLDAVRRQIPSIRTTVVLEYLGDGYTAPDDETCSWETWLAGHAPGRITFERLPFDHPLWVLYSSGTTGLPKCILHRAGGILIKHLVEHQLNFDLRPDDRIFWFTTTGWMMWNWLASSLASEATVVAYDGSPVHPSADVLWRLAEETGLTVFGTSPRFLDASARAAVAPGASFDLSALRMVGATGSVLPPGGFDYVYQDVKDDVHLASVSGGTDLCGCLVGGDPTGPVWRGEIQAPSLGYAIQVVDSDGESVEVGQSGELVCAAPFPSMPLGFWGDDDDSRFRATYFDRFPGKWHQGDFATWTRHGGIVISGRSDATLNAGGVRIGTAEIYRQLEGEPDIVDAIAVAQDWAGDTRIVLLVVIRDGKPLSAKLESSVRTRIREGASPRHVPALIAAVPELPRTHTNKLAEIAVRDILSGRETVDSASLANPESLTFIRAVAPSHA